MSTRPSPDSIVAAAQVSGVPIDQATAERVARSIGPAFEGFASVAGTLAFDLEPSTFVLAQREAQR